jgi:hypothetical protein
MADPAATCGTLVNAALRIAGITGRPGRTPSTDQSTEAINVLNRMMGSWNCDRLKIFQVGVDRYALTPQQSTYFIGPNGDFVAPRPAKIVRANVVLTATSPEIHRPLRIYEVEDWAALSIPELQTGAWSSRLYYDHGMPDAQIFLYPIPGEPDDLELFTYYALQQFAALTDVVVLPDGYEQAITENLALKLATYYPWDAHMDPDVARQANQSLAAIEGLNGPVPRLKNDAADLGHGHRGASRWWIAGMDLD